jgi:hypothetical protein
MVLERELRGFKSQSEDSWEGGERKREREGERERERTLSGSFTSKSRWQNKSGFPKFCICKGENILMYNQEL